MDFLENRRLLVRVANMYYEEGATQSDIAEAIGVSRSLVSKYLTKARELGIVEITIHDDYQQQHRTLERKLERLYGLREAFCIDTVGQEAAKKHLGEAASKYLLRVMKDDQIIGLSSGTTLSEIAKALNSPQIYPNATFIPMVGGMGDERVDIHANTLAARIGDTMQAKYELLHVPVMVDTKEAKEILMRQPSIKQKFEIAEKANIALVGIGGSPDYSTMVKTYLGKEYQNIKDDNSIVGDICYNFINKYGKPVNNLWNDRVLALDLEKLKKIPLVIGVASGLEKVDAIQAALIGDLIDVLITDEETGNALLQ
ncbi:MAG: sugar-binding transcriptional regulator [Bacillota bacterium]|nr:sugar-binding transcriptional regulator [Bacillota bacterium]